MGQGHKRFGSKAFDPQCVSKGAVDMKFLPDVNNNPNGLTQGKSIEVLKLI